MAPYEGVYSESEWSAHSPDKIDLGNLNPARKIGKLFEVLSTKYTESRSVTTGEFQDKELYEYETLFDLQNGEKVNESIIWGTENYMKTIPVRTNVNKRTTVESRDCFFALGGC